MSTGKPVKIGLAALCADWFRQIGLQAEGGELATMLREDYARMTGVLHACFEEVVAPGLISTVEEARRALQLFAAEGAEALLLVHSMWSEDQPLLALLEGWGGRPILLWNYHPLGRLPEKLRVNDLFRLCGTVGLLQGSAVLQRLGIRPILVSGTPGDPDLERSLRAYATALRLRRDFQGLAAGQIAGRCECMTGTYVRPEILRSRLGAELVAISAQEYAAACAAVNAARVEAFYADLTRRFPIRGVSEPSLRLACRNTLALDDLVARYDLQAVAIQDLDEELHRLVGTRPCLCPPLSAERGVAYAMEGDLHTALGVLAAMRASGSPCMYTEVFTFDPQENLLLMGHAGVHDPRLAAGGSVTLVLDLEYCHSDPVEGAWLEFVMAEGPVTCVSLYDAGQAYRLTVFEGTSLGEPLRLEGYAHAVIRPQVDVRQLIPRLVQRGMTQHFAVAPGRIAETLAYWCRLSGIEFSLEAAA